MVSANLMNMLAVEIFLFSSAGVFIGFYAFYCLLCLRYSRISRFFGRHSIPSDILPRISFIVPVYNEEKVINQRIQNLLGIDYPKEKVEIVFVDGGSDDGTVEKIESQAKGLPLSVKIVKQGSRKGFNRAVIDGFNSTSGEVIFITGAEAQYAPDAPRIMSNYFADPNVGAVNGTMKVSNVGAGLSTELESAYRSLYDFVRLAESNLDSPFDIKGEIAAMRRDVCQHLVENPQLSKKGCIDACISFQAKKDGYRTVYDPEAIYYEAAPESIHDSFKQQIRRAATLIENMLVFKNLILRPKYNLFGMLIMPAHFLMLIVLPFVFASAIVSFVILIVANPSDYVLIGLVVVVILGFLFSRRVQAFAKAQVALIIASLRMIRGTETQKFERLSSVRPKAES